MDEILKIKDVYKSFGEKKILDGLSFDVPRNSVFGFVGRNGAGKTTTMKLILGLYKADAGEIFINGKKLCTKLPSNVNEQRFRLAITLRL